MKLFELNYHKTHTSHILAIYQINQIEQLKWKGIRNNKWGTLCDAKAINNADIQSAAERMTTILLFVLGI